MKYRLRGTCEHLKSIFFFNRDNLFPQDALYGVIISRGHLVIICIGWPLIPHAHTHARTHARSPLIKSRASMTARGRVKSGRRVSRGHAVTAPLTSINYVILALTGRDGRIMTTRGLCVRACVCVNDPRNNDKDARARTRVTVTINGG